MLNPDASGAYILFENYFHLSLVLLVICPHAEGSLHFMRADELISFSVCLFQHPRMRSIEMNTPFIQPVESQEGPRRV